MLCCSKKTTIAGIATALWAWGFDYIWHGKILMEKYAATSAMWRPMEQIQTMGIYCIFYHLVMGLLVASGYYCWRSKVTVGAVGSAECPYRKSMGFGIWLGLVLAVPQLMAYMWLPLETPELPQMWALGEVLKWTAAGFLLNKLYEKVPA